jgi:hypothetical protein
VKKKPWNKPDCTRKEEVTGGEMIEGLVKGDRVRGVRGVSGPGLQGPHKRKQANIFGHDSEMQEVLVTERPRHAGWSAMYQFGA